MSDIKSNADDGGEKNLTFEEAKGRLTYDESDVSDDTLKDANSTTPDFDRKAFNPRGRLQSMGKGAMGAAAVGAAFVGFMVYSMATQSEKANKTPSDSTFRLDDESAEKSAREAAAVVVRSDKPAQQVGVDPFGNPIMGGQDLSTGGVTVPAPGQGQAAADPTAERLEKMRQERMAAIAREQARQDAMRRAPIMAVSASAGPLGAVTGNNGPFSNLRVGGNGEGGGEGGPNAKEPNNLARQLNGMDIERVDAGRLSNRNFLITAGMQIPCVLQTAMDSTQPGLASCLVPQDIWSMNGSVILMEKGTRVLGEYQGGFSRGQNRIFVLWNRAITPSGVSVSLGSPAADQLGRAGMGGKVDNFFWQRFGAALLLSIVGDAGDAISNEVSGADQVFNTPNQAAGVAVQDAARIRPRLRAAQGKEMTIMVARDVDFSKVYSLRLRR
ncbi:type IV secretion system protein VirB10 [Rhizorhapis suberifaciens]|uniref:Type IV secretion system protein VirB10 n=1 Tax=Rhizorhapis suberifaciens TaxID=13656 RepID=A0A840HYV9_9SPHN|nr:type IV secretion system protein VirB10 [Rhizorhapis suberifaciens]MBB4642777.1 type IV secretion system protein VirB10 [Rhizorhapis suberifaciens]